MKSRKSIRLWIYWGLLLLALALFYLAFRKIEFRELTEEIGSVRWPWLLLLLIPSWGGQFLRAWRWQLLLGKGTPYSAVYHSLLFGYFVNLALPRVGELSRCMALQSLKGPPFSRNLGTVVIERVVDVGFLGLVLIGVFVLQEAELRDFLHSAILEPLEARLEWLLLPLLALGLALGLAAFFLFRWIMRSGHRRLRTQLVHLRDGLKSILMLTPSKLSLLILLSTLIWGCYFLTTWFWFFALPSVNGSPVVMAFTLMAVGSLVKTIPLQGGGMGAYHYVIGKLLVLYGFASVSSVTFALLNHGYQTVFYLLFGGGSTWWIFWKKKKEKPYLGADFRTK